MCSTFYFVCLIICKVLHKVPIYLYFRTGECRNVIGMQPLIFSQYPLSQRLYVYFVIMGCSAMEYGGTSIIKRNFVQCTKIPWCRIWFKLYDDFKSYGKVNCGFDIWENLAKRRSYHVEGQLKSLVGWVLTDSWTYL